MIAQTDGKGVTTTIAVDQLNRVNTKSYSGSTPAVTYCYDGSTAGNCSTAPTGSNMIDRLTMISSSASVYKYTAYSAFGEVLSSQQITDGQTYSFPAYSYNNLSQLTSITYPSQRQIDTSYNAAGMATTVTSPGKTYASSIAWAPNGAIGSLALGNGLIEQNCYNARLQTVAIRAGSAFTDSSCSAGSGDLLRLAYSFTGSQNNGNVFQQAITRGGNTWTQTYSYDGVNRLSTAVETGAGNWSQDYDYDAAGNRWVTQHSGAGMWGLTLETGISESWYSAAGTNRVNTWNYDGAGNVLHVGSMDRNFTYDAENRMITAAINGQTSTYTYDGDGRRVKAVTPSGTTIFVYDAMGRLAVEYSLSGASSGVHYRTADALGSTRLVTDGNGQVSRNHDYLPFGEELGPGNGGPARDSTFAGTYSRQKFTGKERDTETGLDWFGSRYLSSAQGRFISPDKPFADQDPLDPQSWNLYSYTRNNPLKYVDRQGEAIEIAWDALNVALGARSFVQNVRAGSYIAAAVDAVGVVVDAAATVTPFIPGGAGSLIRAGRLAGAADDVLGVAQGVNRLDNAVDATKAANKGPSFLVSEGGDVIPVPTGATGPIPVVNPQGKTTGTAFTGGKGGPGLHPNVSGVRVMDPTSQYPNGYVVYQNAAKPRPQGVNPQTGKTVSNADPSRHIPLSPKREPPKPKCQGGLEDCQP